jgi:exosortase/archaeosortase family protein
MWPSFPLEAQLALPMRLMTANLTSKLLALIGIASVSEGTSLVSAADAALGHQSGDLFKLDVAAPCSGIRSLYALLMLAALYGYVFLRRWRPRGVLFLSALPLAIAGNLVRMVLLALGSIWWGSEFAVGKSTADGEEISWFHELAGFAVFAVALGGMFALSSWLERSRWNRRSKAKALPEAERDDDAMPLTLRRSLIVLALAGGVLTLCSFSGSQPPLSEPGVSLELPRTLGAAQGTDFPMTDRERGALASDITLRRMIYMAPNARPTQASVVLSGESRRGLHIPEGCTIGQGWTIMDRQVITVQVGDHQFSAALLRVFMDVKDPTTGAMVRRRGLHVYWFQGVHGVTASSYYEHVFQTYWDAVFRNLNHRWAFVSFFTFLPDSMPGMSDGIEEITAVEDLKMFIGELGPKLIKP